VAGNQTVHVDSHWQNHSRQAPPSQKILAKVGRNHHAWEERGPIGSTNVRDGKQREPRGHDQRAEVRGGLAP
jgi:hypothetical protein